MGEGEALDGEPGHPRGAGDDEQERHARVVALAPQDQQRRGEAGRERQEPPAAVQQRLGEAGAGLVAEPVADRRARDPVLQPVPGQEGEAGPSGGEPDQDGSVAQGRSAPGRAVFSC